MKWKVHGFVCKGNAAMHYYAARNTLLEGDRHRPFHKKYDVEPCLEKLLFIWDKIKNKFNTILIDLDYQWMITENKFICIYTKLIIPTTYWNNITTILIAYFSIKNMKCPHIEMCKSIACEPKSMNISDVF